MTEHNRAFPLPPPGNRDLIIGLDIGSTTVKAVVVESSTKAILWRDYQRHETRQAEKVLELLLAIERTFANVPTDRFRILVTGSGAGPLLAPLGAKFVQEVNAVTLAVDDLHPDVGSVIELGGQDAKIIIYQAHPSTGAKRAIASMNDKCASGTGATIDKCILKVGLDPDALADLTWDPSKLHRVAAKCGVFAETDIVNLVKAGIPAAEIMCSLADAIVMQNLSVLSRGNTLRHRVLLLGGPNAYLPFLQDCWRQRIPETWVAKGYTYPLDHDIADLITVPEHALYYAAYGAVIYGLYEGPEAGRFAGLEGLRGFITHGRQAALGHLAGPPLVRSQAELDRFRARYTIPPFVSATWSAGRTVQGVIGLDGGSTSSKAVLLGTNGVLLHKAYQLSQGNPIADMQALLSRIKTYVEQQGARLEVVGFGTTGYAADVLETSLRADVNLVETVAHMMAANAFFGDIDVICDIGGQDIKVLFMVNHEVRNFRLSNQCSAGNGMLLQAMADQFGVPMTAYADTAFRAQLTPTFSYGCAVFLDADRVNFQKEGFSKEELLAGLALVLPKNIWQYVVQIPRLAQLGTRYVLQGGTQYNLAAVKAQVDYITARVPEAEVWVHPHPGEAGAIGAALEALRVVEQRGHSTFVGLEAAIGLHYTTRNDDTTRCTFCPNYCARTFIDTATPDQRTSRYIAGFSCEKGTVESPDTLKALIRQRKQLKSAYPNLVDYEAKRAFRSVYQPDPMPSADAVLTRFETRPRLFRKRKIKRLERQMQRSSESAFERRQHLRIGMPRVLNMYATAPLWRAYFETLGLRSHNLVFSDPTSEDMWAEGGRYGSIDPCFPAKVVQAHIHQLLFHQHRKAKLDYLFFPCLTHVPTFVEDVMESCCCPIVAGTPKVIRAAFTKERDFFADAGIDYIDGAVCLTKPSDFAGQMFEIFGDRLQITADENAFACEQGFEALRRFDQEMQQRGLEVLEQLEREDRIGVLLLGRPYHLDPGLNHGVLDAFQDLGYPILSIRSIPKDPSWLSRFFQEDLERGFVETPLAVNDVWPENYSTNSVQKVWAAKFAARHPNVVVLDLSSFKCGHDAPTYGLIDNVITASQTPYSALHDIDANKPSGSINIRVKTYAHTLSLYRERLVERREKRSELQRRIDAKRQELLLAWRTEQAAQAQTSPRERRHQAAIDAAYRAYLDEDVDLESTWPEPTQRAAALPVAPADTEFVILD